MAPRAPKSAPKAPQEGSRRLPWGLPRGRANCDPPLFGRSPLRCPEERLERSRAPRGLQEGPKRRQ
eukprot:4484573-Pyramimonas_sp.AAC.1